MKIPTSQVACLWPDAYPVDVQAPFCCSWLTTSTMASSDGIGRLHAKAKAAQRHHAVLPRGSIQLTVHAATGTLHNVVKEIFPAVMSRLEIKSPQSLGKQGTHAFAI